MFYPMPVSEVQRDANLLWWVASLVLIVLAGYTFVESWIAALMLFGLAALVTPYAFNHVLAKLQTKDPLHLRVAIVLVGLIASTYVLNVHVASVQAEQAAATAAEKTRVEGLERQRQADAARAKVESTRQYFTVNKQAILKDLSAAIDARDVGKATALSARYTGVVRDDELLAQEKRLQTLKTELAQAKLEQDRKDKIGALLTELKTLDATNYSKAVSIYTELVQLEPTNKSYQQSLDRFNKAEAVSQAKIAAEQLAAQEREARTSRIQAQFSGWDGSHRNFERMIKRAMNDPDSYDHVETRYIDKGKFIRVFCTFRGKNAFGGMIKNTKVADFDIDGNFLREVE